MKEPNIDIELGHEKNIKNSVAEKAIQDLREEIVKISPEGNKLDKISLAKATHCLNSRMRHTMKSAKELLLKKSQFSG